AAQQGHRRQCPGRDAGPKCAGRRCARIETCLSAACLRTAPASGTEGGEGRLTIEASNASLDDEYVRQYDDLAAGQYVMIAVTDTGTGIPPDILERVYEPFFTTKAEDKGTGLGLAMVYGFLKQSGGHVKIYSEMGAGTTVKLYFPRNVASEDALVAAPSNEVKGGEETVLVVEDDDEVREVAVSMLAELGYRVVKAKDAAGALVIVDSGIPIDLIFTDVMMPGTVRSPGVARKAKERLPDVSVLFTSGYTQNAIVHGGRLDPGVELLSKPYSQEELAHKLRYILGTPGETLPATADSPDTAPANAVSLPATPLHVLVVEDDAA